MPKFSCFLARAGSPVDDSQRGHFCLFITDAVLVEKNRYSPSDLR